MQGRRIISAVVVALFVGSTSGCTAAVEPRGTPAMSAGPAATASAAPSPSPTATATPFIAPTAGEKSVTEVFDPGTFSDPTTIDNQWLPFVPGTHWVLEGSAIVDGARIRRRVLTTTTDLTKMVDGIKTAVNYELDYDDGELVEAEIVFFAQADDGTVWLLGEYPEEYEDGKYVESPAWLAGYEGAQAGIMMKADPQLATPSYSEGWGPKVGWTDRGRVFEMGSETCVPFGCYKGVLVIDEFNRDEPDAHQLKYYESGAGIVRVGWAGANEEEHETLELVKLVHLAPDALANARAAAIVLEQHAYVVSKDLYGLTEPAQQR